MKWLVYFLLVCNIGFAAWHFRGLDSQQDKTVLDISNESQLMLLSEFKQLQQNLLSSTGGRLCYSLGPFTKKSQSHKSQTLLKQNNFETRRIALRDTSESGYWVTLPSSGSRREAEKRLQRLEKLKVKDYFFVATGSHENAISMGVYSLKATAKRRIDELIRLGFIAQMESVALPQKIYWLNWYKDLKIEPDDEIINDIKNKYPQVSIIERSCK